MFHSQGSFNLQFPGPYHPDYIMQLFNMPTDVLPFASVDSSDIEGIVMSPRNHKRRRMSTDSMSEPLSSAVSYSSYTNGYSTSATSATSHSQRSSMEFPFSSYPSRRSQREKKFAKPFASGIKAILLHKKSVIDNLTVDSGLVKADANAMTVMLRTMHLTHQN
jgi:hypothetical protein